ncbi:MAG: hypothetical protein QMD36_00045 [Candidatus Aenigmarchaeota archaeon]|nr:hypothetical protein [Candidatus Aenigmarchaeota archaeon]
MKGQAGIEFMMLMSIMLTIVLIFVWSGLSLRQRIFGTKTNVEAQELCDYIAFEINSAVKAGDGYKRKFYVENEFFGVSAFTITVSEYSVFIDWDSKSVSSPIITENIKDATGVVRLNLQKGMNYNIENKGGEIYVTEIV